MDLARRIYSRELKLAAMREIDNGRTIGEVARLLELSPNLLQRWRGEWQARMGWRSRAWAGGACPAP